MNEHRRLVAIFALLGFIKAQPRTIHAHHVLKIFTRRVKVPQYAVLVLKILTLRLPHHRHCMTVYVRQALNSIIRTVIPANQIFFVQELVSSQLVPLIQFHFQAQRLPIIVLVSLGFIKRLNQNFVNLVHQIRFVNLIQEIFPRNVHQTHRHLRGVRLKTIVFVCQDIKSMNIKDLD